MCRLGLIPCEGPTLIVCRSGDLLKCTQLFTEPTSTHTRTHLHTHTHFCTCTIFFFFFEEPRCHDFWDQSVGDKKPPHTPFTPPHTATIQHFEVTLLSPTFPACTNTAPPSPRAPYPAVTTTMSNRGTLNDLAMPPVLSLFFFSHTPLPPTLHLMIGTRSTRTRTRRKREDGMVDTLEAISSDNGASDAEADAPSHKKQRGPDRSEEEEEDDRPRRPSGKAEARSGKAERIRSDDLQDPHALHQNVKASTASLGPLGSLHSRLCPLLPPSLFPVPPNFLCLLISFLFCVE